MEHVLNSNCPGLFKVSWLVHTTRSMKNLSEILLGLSAQRASDLLSNNSHT